MKKQITEVSGHQTSKVFAAMYFVMTLPFILIGLVGLAFKGHGVHFPSMLFFLLPFIYCILGYIFTRFACFLYNFIAKRIGGVEFTVTEK